MPMTPAEITWIRQAISASALGLAPNAPRDAAGALANGFDQGVFVANPSPAIRTSGMTAATPAKLNKYPLRKAPEIGTPGVTAKSILEWGLSFAKRSPTYAGFNGYCVGFAAVSAAILVAPDHQFTHPVTVEQISSGSAAAGHVYLVIDRDPASAVNAAVNTWGVDCVIVDQWYALQTDTPSTKRTDAWWAANNVPLNDPARKADRDFGVVIDGYGTKNLVTTFPMGLLKRGSGLV